jgi:hypothetical protein
MLGRDARCSLTSAHGGREDWVLRSGTKTNMNDPIGAELRLFCATSSVFLHGESRRSPRTETNPIAAETSACTNAGHTDHAVFFASHGTARGNAPTHQKSLDSAFRAIFEAMARAVFACGRSLASGFAFDART